MTKARHCLLFIFTFMMASSWPVHGDNKPFTINVFSCQNGRGLQTDQAVLRQALEKLGHTVNSSEQCYSKEQTSLADISIFIEMINPDLLGRARTNWFIPNPEWIRQETSLIERCDLILCRTEEVERIFRSLNMKTYLLGFTSPDCYDPHTAKDYTQLLHLAGGSNLKGTPVILKAWKDRPELPPLTIVKKDCRPDMTSYHRITWISAFLPEPDLRSLQNRCGIHLCPSETEGFGHYIMEAMSAGAVVITTDAPPMNTFITDPRCLVPYRNSSRQSLGILYHADPTLLEMKVKDLMKLRRDELQAIGARNRAVYLQKTADFHQRLEQLINLINLIHPLTN